MDSESQTPKDSGFYGNEISTLRNDMQQIQQELQKKLGDVDDNLSSLQHMQALEAKELENNIKTLYEETTNNQKQWEHTKRKITEAIINATDEIEKSAFEFENVVKNVRESLAKKKLQIEEHMNTTVEQLSADSQRLLHTIEEHGQNLEDARKEFQQMEDQWKHDCDKFRAGKWTDDTVRKEVVDENDERIREEWRTTALSFLDNWKSIGSQIEERRSIVEDEWDLRDNDIVESYKSLLENRQTNVEECREFLEHCVQTKENYRRYGRLYDNFEAREKSLCRQCEEIEQTIIGDAACADTTPVTESELYHRV